MFCLTSQQHASVSQGRICSDKCMCCHIEIEAADQTFHLTQSQYTDTGPTRHSTDSITPGAWQGGHWSVYFKVTGMTRPGKIPAKVVFFFFSFVRGTGPGTPPARRDSTGRTPSRLDLKFSIHVTWFALHFHCAPLAQCIRLRRWFSCPSFPLVDDPPTKAEEHPLP